MAKYKKRPVVIEATQWLKNGDHPQDSCDRYDYTDGSGSFLSEGKVVRYFRSPDVPGANLCNFCQGKMRDHGWIDTLEGGFIVCPGDWIITGVINEIYPCKPDVFIKTYEPIEEENH